LNTTVKLRVHVLKVGKRGDTRRNATCETIFIHVAVELPWCERSEACGMSTLLIYLSIYPRASDVQLLKANEVTDVHWNGSR